MRKLNALRAREDGFTLIELLIVVLIIGILAAVAIPLYLNIQNGAHKSAIQSDVHTAVTSAQVALTEGGSVSSLASTKTGGDGESVVTTIDSDGKNFTVTASESKAAGGNVDYVYNYSSKSGQFSEGVIPVAAPTPGYNATTGAITYTAEVGDPTNADVTGTYGATYSGYSTAQSHTGSRSYQIPAGNGYQLNFSTESGWLTPGKTYTVTAWVYIDTLGSTTSSSAVADQLQTIGTSTGSSTGYSAANQNKWVKLTQTFTYTNDAGNYFGLMFYTLPDGPSNMYVDDVTIIPN